LNLADARGFDAELWGGGASRSFRFPFIFNNSLYFHQHRGKNALTRLFS